MILIKSKIIAIFVFYLYNPTLQGMMGGGMMDGGAMMGPGGNMGPGNNMVRTLFNDFVLFKSSSL